MLAIWGSLRICDRCMYGGESLGPVSSQINNCLLTDSPPRKFTGEKGSQSLSLNMLNFQSLHLHPGQMEHSTKPLHSGEQVQKTSAPFLLLTEAQQLKLPILLTTVTLLSKRSKEQQSLDIKIQGNFQASILSIWEHVVCLRGPESGPAQTYMLTCPHSTRVFLFLLKKLMIHESESDFLLGCPTHTIKMKKSIAMFLFRPPPANTAWVLSTKR